MATAFPLQKTLAKDKSPLDLGHPTKPQIFAEGIISTQDDESNGAFSPGGTEYYFTKVNQSTTFPQLSIICVSRFRGGKWSEPEVVPFSGMYLDFPPRLSPDGNTIYFASARPLPDQARRGIRLWSVERNGSGWGDPKPLPSPINTPDNHWNWGASVTRDGTMYFASSREGTGHHHIFRSRLVNGAYSEPEKLGPEVNSEFNDLDPFISPDESILVFSSSGEGLPSAKDRPETIKSGGVNYARADLYVSFNRGGHWTKAKHIEHGVNTSADEGSAAISPDGRYLFFHSERSPFTVPISHRLSYEEIERTLHSPLNGHGNIFYIAIDALEAPTMKEPR